jgi:hypothetical protein
MKIIILISTLLTSCVTANLRYDKKFLPGECLTYKNPENAFQEKAVKEGAYFFIVGVTKREYVGYSCVASKNRCIAVLLSVEAKSAEQNTKTVECPPPETIELVKPQDVKPDSMVQSSAESESQSLL